MWELWLFQNWTLNSWIFFRVKVHDKIKTSLDVLEPQVRNRGLYGPVWSWRKAKEIYENLVKIDEESLQYLFS